MSDVHPDVFSDCVNDSGLRFGLYWQNFAAPLGGSGLATLSGFSSMTCMVLVSRALMCAPCEEYGLIADQHLVNISSKQ